MVSADPKNPITSSLYVSVTSRKETYSSIHQQTLKLLKLFWGVFDS